MQATCDRIRRARPLLGTFVEITAGGACAETLERGVEAAFGAIETVHRLMSFHEETSDVSRLNRAAARAPVEVHSWTYRVLRAALDVNVCSCGLFDIRIASALQRIGLLPGYAVDKVSPLWPVPGLNPGMTRPPEGKSPSESVDNRLDPQTRSGGGHDGITQAAEYGEQHGEIELLPSNRVRFGSKAMKIDLGGIAKGFAVDRAIDVLREHGITTGLVNAGGDLRVFGQVGEMITIRHPADPRLALCELALCEGALASSGTRFDPFEASTAQGPALIDPVRGEPLSAIVGASVKAPSCLIADALTKIVMLGALSSAPVLRHYGASAIFVTKQGVVYATPEWNDRAVLAA